MIVVASIMVFMVLLGAFTLMYQIFRLVVLDAESRGMKHPTFWGIFSLSGNNGGGGLILYLLGRNRFPANMTETTKESFDSRKRKAGLSLCFIAIGTIALIFIALFGNLLLANKIRKIKINLFGSYKYHVLCELFLSLFFAFPKGINGTPFIFQICGKRVRDR